MATSYLSPFVGQLNESIVHLGCHADSGISELQSTLLDLVGNSSQLLGDMKPVVRESLNNLDDGMLKTLVAFCESSEEQTTENFVAWLNSRGQVEVMLMWVESMTKVICRSHACYSRTRIPRVLLTPSPTCPRVTRFLCVHASLPRITRSTATRATRQSTDPNVCTHKLVRRLVILTMHDVILNLKKLYW